MALVCGPRRWSKEMKTLPVVMSQTCEFTFISLKQVLKHLLIMDERKNSEVKLMSPGKREGNYTQGCSPVTLILLVFVPFGITYSYDGVGK